MFVILAIIFDNMILICAALSMTDLKRDKNENCRHLLNRMLLQTSKTLIFFCRTREKKKTF